MGKKKYPIICGILAAILTLIYINSIIGKTSQPPPIIIILLDTLRADHLGVHGYKRDTSPNLDNFAKDNINFTYAITAAPWTPPSIASIFTGRYTPGHGMMPPNGREEAEKQLVKLKGSLNTIAEHLSMAGYQTAGVSPNPWITKGFGYDQGFGQFIELPRETRAEGINSTALSLLNEFNRNKPFFLYLHYLDPHNPYSPPDEYATMYTGKTKSSYDEKMERYINLYDGEIRYLDHSLGQLFSELKKLDIYERALIIIVADHGEQFMEHGNHGHGFRLFNEEIHIPLFVKPPKKYNKTPKEVKHTVSTIDIFTTVLSVSGIKDPTILQSGQGVSLLDDHAITARSGVISEIRRRYFEHAFIDLDGRKLIKKYEDDSNSISKESYFDKTKDYSELVSISEFDVDTTDLKKKMQELFDASRMLGNSTDDEKAVVEPETVEQLKSLGYLQ